MNLACKLVAMAAVGLGFYLGQSDAFGQAPRRDDGPREMRPNRDGPREDSRDGAQRRDGGRGEKAGKHRKHAMKKFMKHHRHHMHHKNHGAGKGGPGGEQRGQFHRGPERGQQFQGENFRGGPGRDGPGRGEMQRGPGPRGENFRGQDGRPNFDGPRRGPEMRRGPEQGPGRGQGPDFRQFNDDRRGPDAGPGGPEDRGPRSRDRMQGERRHGGPKGDLIAPEGPRGGN